MVGLLWLIIDTVVVVSDWIITCAVQNVCGNTSKQPERQVFFYADPNYVCQSPHTKCPGSLPPYPFKRPTPPPPNLNRDTPNHFTPSTNVHTAQFERGKGWAGADLIISITKSICLMVSNCVITHLKKSDIFEL